MKKVLAIDLGSSSGRHIVGSIENGKLKLEEVYRFENNIIIKNGVKCWDWESLLAHINEGIRRSFDYDIKTLSIDSWGVDYVLIDKNGEVVGNAVSYVDNRTEGFIESTADIISKKDLYNRVGLQYYRHNTLYQLLALKKQNTNEYDKADRLLFTPDFYTYKLTGKKVNEYCISSTSGLINAKSRNWDYDLFKILDIKETLFDKPVKPGSFVGNLLENNKIEVITAPSHDTASAVMSVPNDNSIYLSSGSWSLMGINIDEPMTNDISYGFDFTNEGGYNNSIRYLKNIPGMRFLQIVRKEFDKKFSFKEMIDLAEKEKPYKFIIDVEDKRFTNPNDMVSEIQQYCKKNGMDKPISIGELTRCVIDSLSLIYYKVFKELEITTGKKFNDINIIGGGSKNDLLNQITANITGLTVYAGPIEGTAIGNILNQLIYLGELSSLSEGKDLIKNTFKIKKFIPQNIDYTEVIEKYKKLKELK